MNDTLKLAVHILKIIAGMTVRSETGGLVNLKAASPDQIADFALELAGDHGYLTSMDDEDRRRFRLNVRHKVMLDRTQKRRTGWSDGSGNRYMGEPWAVLVGLNAKAAAEARIPA